MNLEDAVNAFYKTDVKKYVIANYTSLQPTRHELKKFDETNKNNNVTDVETSDISKKEEIKANVENTEIDSLSDEELFLLDLKDTSPDLTDEECIAALEHEKGNQILWEKRMQGLRNSYKAKETAKRNEEEILRQEEEQRQVVEFQDAIQNAVDKVDSIGEFDLDDSDKEEIAEFILGVDKTGTRYFARALNDPETLTKMAWFALNGEEALETLSKYYKEQIESYSKANYNKGFEDAKNGKQPDKVITQKTTVRKPESKQVSSGYKPVSSPYLIDLD